MKSLNTIIVSWVLSSTAALLTGCSTSCPAPVAGVVTDPAPITQAEQQAMTPDEALARLIDGNKRFTTGRSVNRDYISEVRASAAGQYPFATVLSCIDSRI